MRRGVANFCGLNQSKEFEGMLSFVIWSLGLRSQSGILKGGNEILFGNYLYVILTTAKSIGSKSSSIKGG